jgi:branched-chain amino acid transport system permease protein
MTDLLQNIISAVSLGGLYALAALGVALIFGVMSLVNFAQGSFIMVGAYVVVGLSSAGPVIAILGAVVVVVLLSLITERVAFREVREASLTTMLITSFAVSFLIESLIVLTLGSIPRSTSFLSGLGQGISIFGLTIARLDLVTIVVSAVLLTALAIFLKRTSTGIQMRAASADFTMARLLGVKANFVIAIAFAVSGFLAASVSVLFVAKQGQASPTMALQLVLIAFVATVIGGLGSVLGAAIAGFGLGCLTVTLSLVLPVSIQKFTEAGVYIVVILVLLLRPAGLLGGYSANERV